MAGPIKSFTTSVEPASFRRAIETLSAHQFAARLKAAGDEIYQKSNERSLQFEPRTEERRRNAGQPELANSFVVHYTGLDQARLGAMKFWLTSDAPSFWYLEYGTPPHTISPRNPAGRLWWPGDLSSRNVLLLPGQSVHHPGSRKYEKTWRRLIARALRDRFPGIRIPFV